MRSFLSTGPEQIARKLHSSRSWFISLSVMHLARPEYPRYRRPTCTRSVRARQTVRCPRDTAWNLIRMGIVCSGARIKRGRVPRSTANCSRKRKEVGGRRTTRYHLPYVHPCLFATTRCQFLFSIRSIYVLPSSFSVTFFYSAFGRKRMRRCDRSINICRLSVSAQWSIRFIKTITSYIILSSSSLHKHHYLLLMGFSFNYFMA